MEALTPALMETLLNAGEGPTLDYKSQQYPFAGAADNAKAELLKDILAMANGWKTSDAFILVGAKDRPGHRAEVLGIATSDFIDDASVQQFVNQKTNRPIRFECKLITVDRKQIEVLQIAREQERPIWLKKTFGKLTAQTVYMRRGSSTTIADPDEIARMGSQEAPRAKVLLATTDARSRGFSEEVVLTSRIQSNKAGVGRRSTDRRELFDLGLDEERYNQWLHQVHALCVQVVNVGTVALVNPHVQLRISPAQGVTPLDRQPRMNFGYDSTSAIYHLARFTRIREPSSSKPSVRREADRWLLTFQMKTVSAGRDGVSERVWIGCSEPILYVVSMNLAAENLPQPLTEMLRIQVKTEPLRRKRKPRD